MSWSASFKPRSAKTFPEPTSTLVDFRLFVLTGQLLCFGVSSLDQIDVPLRRLNAFLRLLLEGVQNIDSCAQPYCRHHAISVGGIAESKLNNAAADAFKRFRILGRAAELDQLQLVAEQFLRPFRKTLKIPFRISQPHQRPQYWPFKAIHVSTLRVYSKSTISSISLRCQYGHACTRYSYETR